MSSPWPAAVASSVARIAAELHRRGDRVVVLSQRAPAAARGPLPDEVEVRHVDVTTGAGLHEALAGVDALVISLAFRNSPMEKPSRGRTFMEVDAAATERLVAAAREAGVRRLVYLSGAGAAPDAKRVWFRAKARAESAVRASGLPSRSSARPGSTARATSRSIASSASPAPCPSCP